MRGLSTAELLAGFLSQEELRDILSIEEEEDRLKKQKITTPQPSISPHLEMSETRLKRMRLFGKLPSTAPFANESHP